MGLFVVKNFFSRGKIDSTLFIKFDENDNLLIFQIYVDDIIFGTSNEYFCKWFSDTMSKEFDMSLMGELNWFLGLQIKQIEEGIHDCGHWRVKNKPHLKPR